MSKIKQQIDLLESYISILCSSKMQGRFSGTQGAKLAAEYLADKLKEFGYQPFGENGYFDPLEVPSTRLAGQAKLTIGNWKLKHRIDFGEMRLSSGGTYKGPLVIVKDGENIEEDIAGKIVFIPEQPPGFDLEETVKAAVNFGVKGLLYENGEPRWFRKSVAVFSENSIPVIRIRQSLAQEIECRKGMITDIQLPLATEKRYCQNVMGFLPGKNTEHTIALTAHYDHVGDDLCGYRYPGAFDNASGVATILEVARLMSSYSQPLPFNILVVFLTGEESGLWGAKHLVDNLPISISAVINLDVLGMNPDLKLMRIGHEEHRNWFVSLAAKVMESFGVEVDWSIGRDDSIIFSNANIPTIGLGEYGLSSVGPNIHTPEDSIETVHFTALSKGLRIISEIIHQLASNPDLLSN